MALSGYTQSQAASAEAHLAEAATWHFVRIGGIHYVILPSARSGHVYTVRADAAGCSCPHYERTARVCAHMLAVARYQERENERLGLCSETELEIAFSGVAADAAARDGAYRRLARPAVVPLKTYAQLYPEGNDD